MSTTSIIALRKKGSAEITSIYCHFDGYIKNGVGERLLKYYTDVPTIEKLLALGDLSVLGNTPVSAGSEIWKNSHIERDKDLCIDYKARGETNVEAKTDDSIVSFSTRIGSRGAFIYLFDEEDNCWYYTERHLSKLRLKPLTLK